MAITRTREKGSLTIPILSRVEGRIVSFETREFYYDYAVWVDDVKFVLGCFDEEGTPPNTMLEVYTGATAVTPADFSTKANVDSIINKYLEKCATVGKGKTSAQLVANFIQHFNIIELWQTKLWVL